MIELYFNLAEPLCISVKGNDGPGFFRSLFFRNMIHLYLFFKLCARPLWQGYVPTLIATLMSSSRNFGGVAIAAFFPSLGLSGVRFTLFPRQLTRLVLSPSGIIPQSREGGARNF